MDGEKLREILGYVREGLGVEGACRLVGVGVEEVDGGLVGVERVKLERELLGMMRRGAGEMCDGGKGNVGGVMWLLERLYPERYGKVSVEDGGKRFVLQIKGGEGVVVEGYEEVVR